MEIFENGETIRVNATITASDVPVTPSISITCTITDPIGAAIVTVAMNPSGVGIYYYDYLSSDTALEGKYIATIVATDTRITKKRAAFRLRSATV